MIGNKIRMLRLKHGYSVSQLSAKANVSKSYLSNLENHKKKNPSLSVLSKIAETLGTTVDDLIGGQDEPSVNDNFYMEELDDEWVRLLKKGVQEGMSKKEFNEFQLYLKFRKKHFH
ncbi:helix-turn-helix domain-containing protein [Jeotgalibacillus sp. JSM ZJ347]|uniref:helix-turn-helix domain-containing protein n=1 Tax=Jeotgalibacillus sp. JSM ZJ347 TaxID=3342117 RepID=UPI0035A9410D